MKLELMDYAQIIPFFIINEQTIYYTFVSTYVYVQRT
jgi:hypothetical protein